MMILIDATVYLIGELISKHAGNLLILTDQQSGTYSAKGNKEGSSAN